MSAANRIKVLSEPLAPPAGVHYPEGTTLRAVTRTKRRKGDFYETPSHAVDAIIPFLPLGNASLVIDAGAGTGAIAARIANKYPRLTIIGVDKDGELVKKARAREIYAAEFIEADFEKWEPTGAPPEIVIMNPPYARALEFVQRALAIVKRGGTVAALLRISWCASKGRREWLEKHMPNLRVLTKRPSFTGTGTDATDYAWFVWEPGGGGEFSLLKNEEKKNAGGRKKWPLPKRRENGLKGTGKKGPSVYAVCARCKVGYSTARLRQHMRQCYGIQACPVCKLAFPCDMSHCPWRMAKPLLIPKEHVPYFVSRRRDKEGFLARARKHFFASEEEFIKAERRALRWLREELERLPWDER